MTAPSPIHVSAQPPAVAAAAASAVAAADGGKIAERALQPRGQPAKAPVAARGFPHDAVVTNNLDLFVIGNCQVAALIDAHGRYVWMCLPSFDGDPVFNCLVNGGLPEPMKGQRPRPEPRAGPPPPPAPGPAAGFFDVCVQDLAATEQGYLPNTAILRTVFRDAHGAQLEVLDFAPRFSHYGRTFRPQQVVRILRPLTSKPCRIVVRLRPTFDYGATAPVRVAGSNHVRFMHADTSKNLRATVEGVASRLLMDEVPFLCVEPATLVLGPDEPLSKAPREIGREFLEETRLYWREHYSRFLSIPLEWQDAVIRSAITLKLCCYEATGAVVAAHTTSIPEAGDLAGRCWDYRFNWLRDSFFTVTALSRLGDTKTMEDYLRYITNLVAASEDGYLQPLYGLGLESGSALDEKICTSLVGYRGQGPVRIGNAAYTQVQNDVYGAVVLACTQAFFDARLSKPGDRDLFESLERLGEQAAARFNVPDAGIWEFRAAEQPVHTFSAAMCWAACDRLALVARRLQLEERAEAWRKRADAIKAEIEARAYDAERNCFVEAFGGRELDASLLLLTELKFVSGADPRFVGTVEAIGRELRSGDHVFRYKFKDDFGFPENAFTICTFWRDEARGLFEGLLACANAAGIFSEDICCETREMWGNYPQSYSAVGVILCAMRLSASWDTVL
eukprot:tig00021532_g22189.t1